MQSEKVFQQRTVKSVVKEQRNSAWSQWKVHVNGKHQGPEGARDKVLHQRASKSCIFRKTNEKDVLWTSWLSTDRNKMTVHSTHWSQHCQPIMHPCREKWFVWRTPHNMSSNSSLVPLISREIITEGSWEGLTLVGPSMNTSILQKNLGHLIPLKWVCSNG